jgi:hypothetical protein
LIEERATDTAIEAAVEKGAVTKERALLEVARLASSDIRKAVEWHETLAEESDNRMAARSWSSRRWRRWRRGTSLS